MRVCTCKSYIIITPLIDAPDWPCSSYCSPAFLVHINIIILYDWEDWYFEFADQECQNVWRYFCFSFDILGKVGYHYTTVQHKGRPRFSTHKQEYQVGLFRKPTVRHSWYTPTGLRHCNGCRCPGVKEAPGHQQPPCWFDFGYIVCHRYHVAFTKQTIF